MTIDPRVVIADELLVEFGLGLKPGESVSMPLHEARQRWMPLATDIYDALVDAGCIPGEESLDPTTGDKRH